MRLVKVRQSVTEKQVKIRIRALTNLVGYLLGFSTMVTRRRSQIPNEHRQSRHGFIRALNHIHHSGDTRIIMTDITMLRDSLSSMPVSNTLLCVP